MTARFVLAVAPVLETTAEGVRVRHPVSGRSVLCAVGVAEVLPFLARPFSITDLLSRVRQRPALVERLLSDLRSIDVVVPATPVPLAAPAFSLALLGHPVVYTIGFIAIWNSAKQLQCCRVDDLTHALDSTLVQKNLEVLAITGVNPGISNKLLLSPQTWVRQLRGRCGTQTAKVSGQHLLFP